MKNILITGITGFIGRNLVEYFAERDEIKIFGHSRDIFQAKKLFKQKKIEFLSELNVDVLDRNHIEIIIHLAGIAHDLSGHYRSEDYDLVNNIGTRKLFDQFTDSQASTFIFVSSIKAVIDHFDGEVHEEMDPKPTSAYGISKLKAEQYINQHKGNNKKNYILRPCLVHGPGNKGNLNLLYKFVRSGMPYPLGAFENQRSFLSIENFCFVINAIINNQLPPDTYFLSDEKSIATNELVRIIGIAIGKNIRILKIPKPLINLLASIGSVFHLPFRRSNISKLTENLIVSNKKLLLNLNSNLPVTAEEGLLKTIKSFDE